LELSLLNNSIFIIKHLKLKIMAIQTNGTFTYNSGVYTTPYFRIVLHLPQSGEETPVDCFMYASQNDYTNGNGHIACIAVYVSNTDAVETNDGSDVVNKYLQYVTEKVVTRLREISSDSTFTIVGIPTL